MLIIPSGWLRDSIFFNRLYLTLSLKVNNYPNKIRLIGRLKLRNLKIKDHCKSQTMQNIFELIVGHEQNDIPAYGYINISA